MSSSILCKQCNQPITFDNKHISQRTGKKVPLDPGTNEPHDCPARENSSNHNYHNNSHTKKGDIINVTKAAVRKSILMQIAKVRAANSFHLTKLQESHINVNSYIITCIKAGVKRTTSFLR